MLKVLKNEVVTGTFNRTNKLNAVNLELCHAVQETVNFANQHAKIFILQGSGRSFSVGGDLKHVLDLALEQQMEVSLGDECKMTIHAINTCKPTLITLMNGFIMGVGAGFGVHAPIRVATENSIFAMPEIKVGLVPDGGCGIFFSRMPKNFGLYLALTGEQIGGVEMCHLGLADFLIESKDLPKITHEIEESHLMRDVDSIREYLHHYCQKSRTTLFDLPNQLEQTLSLDNLIAINETLQVTNCPFAQEVYFEQHNRNIAQSLDLKQNLLMEQRILDHMVVRPDMVEGLRRQFVDKKYVPQWNPMHLRDVSHEDVLRCFLDLERKPLQI